jgi:beta-N-acetylhexosaminidase
MTAHILLPDVGRDWPASLSPTILDKILRTEMKFQGVILTDDLGMGAIAQRWPPGDAAVQTFRAGSDLALLCHDWSLVRPAIEAVASALGKGKIHPENWNASRGRIAKLRQAAQSAEKQVP